MRFGWASALLLLLAAQVSAQSEYGGEVGVGAGRQFGGLMARGTSRLFPDGVNIDDTRLKGFWIDAQLNHGWSAEFAVRRSSGTMTSPGQGLFPYRPVVAGIDVTSVEVAALRSINVRALSLYAGAGAGITNLDVDTSDPGDQDSTRPAISIAAGAKVHLMKHAGVGVDVRRQSTYLGRRAPGIDRGWRDRDRWLRSPEIEAGAFVSFGKP
jgi:opacity protein-like surface antigen